MIAGRIAIFFGYPVTFVDYRRMAYLVYRLFDIFGFFTVLEESFYRVVLRITVVQQHGRQSESTLVKVGAGRFAQLFLGPDEVQDIVYYLKSQSQIMPVFFQTADCFSGAWLRIPPDSVDKQNKEAVLPKIRLI